MFGFSKWERLKRCIEDGDLVGVSRLMGNRSDAERTKILQDLTEKTGTPPVIAAIHMNRKDIARYLLADTIPQAQAAPLMFAAQTDDDKAIDFMIANGVSPDIRMEENGYTALHVAVEKNKTGAMRCLVDAGADVNAQATEWETSVLLLAVKHMTSPDIYYLLWRGANPLLESKFSYTKNDGTTEIGITNPLQCATVKGYFDSHFIPKENTLREFAFGGHSIEPIKKDDQSNAKQVDTTFGKWQNSVKIAEQLKVDKILLQRMVTAGTLLALFDELPYNNAIDLYPEIRSRITEDDQKIIENKIRHARYREME